MRRHYLAVLVIALIAEVGTSWWRWVRAPTDSLRVWYEGSFWAYQMGRLIPWAIILAMSMIVWFLIEKRIAPK
jgi:hypothetical protein